MLTFTRTLNFVDITGFTPGQTVFTLDDTVMPAGALDQSHLTFRSRIDEFGLWTVWIDVAQWNQDTRVLTLPAYNVAHTVLRIRRMTPRDVVLMPPTRPEQAVDAENLRIQADQGQMIAYEWAGQLGLDPLQVLLTPDYSETSPELRSLTQAHWPADHDFTQRNYNFRFSGGYMAREHVRAQVLTPGGWQLLSVDPRHWDIPDNNSPFRFVGPWTLHLDMDALGPVSGLVIHRHTPRTARVAVIADGATITASGMEPSATQSLFIAVELGEELSKIVPCECLLYYTSTLYPLTPVDTVASASQAVAGDVLQIEPSDAYGTSFPVSGTLVDTIHYYVLNNFGTSSGGTDATFNLDLVSGGIPTPMPGTLESTVVFLNWNNSDATPEFSLDLVAGSVPQPQASTLVVTVVYVTYNNFLAPDLVSGGIPEILSGTLV